MVFVQIRRVIVRRKTADAQIVQELFHFFGLRVAPFEVRSIEFQSLVAHRGNGPHGSLRIFFQFVADRVHFDAHGNRSCRARAQGPGHHRSKRQESSTGKSSCAHIFIRSKTRTLSESYSALCAIATAEQRCALRLAMGRVGPAAPVSKIAQMRSTSIKQASPAAF